MDERGFDHVSASSSDDELIAMVQEPRGHANERERAFEILFERYHAKIYRWCALVLGDPTRGEDVAQAILLDLWEGRHPYQGRGRFGAWLYVLCRNRCLNAMRGERRRSDAEWDPDLAQALSTGSDPQSELEASEIGDRIDDVCRERLNEIEQQVTTLRYRWGMKVDEITNALGLTNASGARTHLRNAETKLRRHLKTLRRETEGR